MGRDQATNLHERLLRLTEAYEKEVAKSSRMVELANEAWDKVRESEKKRLELIGLLEKERNEVAQLQFALRATGKALELEVRRTLSSLLWLRFRLWRGKTTGRIRTRLAGLRPF